MIVPRACWPCPEPPARTTAAQRHSRTHGARHRATRLTAIALIALAGSSAPAQFYTDSGSPANPPWSAIRPTLNTNAADPGPVYGSAINVSNAAVEVGLYGKRPISVGTQKIHVCCNTSVGSGNFADFTRWFQTDGNTQVIRLFVEDENTATTRAGAARCEAFTADGWTYTNHVTYEWTGRYTIAHRQQAYCILQVKNDDNDWAVQLFLNDDGSLTVNNRRNLPDVTVTNANGSVKDFDGLGFDVRVLDDGQNFKLWVDGVQYTDNFYLRPTAETKFRWGSYYGDNIVNPPADYNLILVSGAQVRSWPGDLTTPTTTLVKRNNTTNLEVGASWVGGTVPGLYNQAVWDSTVTAANTTTLGSDQQWAGLAIRDPGGLVTINGVKTLGLDASGVDMSAATRDLAVNCPLELTASGSWDIATNRTATCNGAIRGYAGITADGDGTLLLNAANTFTGPLTLNAGTVWLALANAQSGTILNSNAVLRVASSGALGAGGLTMAPSGGATGRLELSGGVTVLDGKVLAWSGRTSATEAIRNVSGSNTLAATISVLPGGTNYWIRSDAGQLTLSGTVTAGASGTPTVTLRGAASGIVTGVIEDGSGTVALTKAGTGIWTLAGANTYSGPTTVSSGTLKNGSAVAFALNGPLNVSDTGTFDLNGNPATFTAIQAGAVTATITNSGAGAVLCGSAQGSTTISNLIGGNLTLTIANPNSSVTALALGNQNTFTGGLTLLHGTASGTRLRINALITGTPYGSGVITIGLTNTDHAGILFDVVPNNTLPNDVTFNTALGTDVPGIRFDTPGHVLSGRIIANLADATFSAGASSTGSVTLTGVISGAGGLALTPPTTATSSALTLALNSPPGTNSYAGDTTISRVGNSVYTLTLGADEQLPNGGGKGDVSVDGALDLHGFDETVNGLSGSGTVDNRAAGAVTLTVGDNNQSSTFLGVLQGTTGSLALVKIGTGTVTFAGASTYAGRTTISNGIVQAENAKALGTGAIVFSGGTRLAVGAGIAISNAITLGANRGVAGRGLIEPPSNATATVSGSITISNAASAGGHFASTGTGVLNVSGAITSVVPVTLRSGAAVFSGGGSYTGFYVTGTAKLGATNGISTNAVVDVGHFGDGVLDLNGFDQRLAGLTGGSAYDAIATNAGAVRTLALAVGGTNAFTFGGVIAGSIALVKTGTGTQTLTGASTHTGGTLVHGGTFNLTGSLDSAVVVSNGVFQGTGIINNSLTMCGGTNAPGGSSGVLTVRSNYVLMAGATLAVEIKGLTAGTQYDQIQLTGAGSTITLAGTLQISPTNGLPLGASFTIITNRGSAMVTGAFAGLPENSTFLAGGQWWRISYAGGSGNDVVLTTTTAPNTAPTLAAIADRTLIAGQTLTVTNVASDADLPVQALTFSLPASPAGATIAASSGLVTWRPDIAQGGTTNPVQVRVTDDGSPMLSATQSFTVIVLAPQRPATAATASANGQLQLTISGDTGPDYIIEATTNLVSPDWQAQTNIPSPALPMVYTLGPPTNSPCRFIRIRLGP